jgi:endoglucanase
LQVNGIAQNQQQLRNKIENLVGPKKTAEFYNAWLANHCTKTDIDSMASWGFNSVRLPMHYDLYTLPVEMEKDSMSQTWIQKGFAMTDSLLSWCKANRIYLILDLHAAPGGQGTDVPISDRDENKPSLWQSNANRNKTIALWKALAQRYANEEWIGGYDLINETNWGFTNPADKNGCGEKVNAELRALLVEITNAIRSVDSRHMIFIEGNCWANNYNGMFPLWDNNMVVSFHKYWNYNTPETIAGFIKIRDEHNVPLWMGEAGENSNAWFTDAITLLEKNEIGWAWWPLKKLGSNNPLQIKSSEGYQNLLRYWRGEEKKLEPKEANKILMDFARSTHISKNIFHRGVVDAMFRQVRTDQTIPFKSHLLRNDLIIYATDYDLGHLGKAYHDNEAGNYWVSTQKRNQGNRGGQYRNDGVDIGICTDSLSNGYFVGWTEPGEWIQYTIHVSKEGWFNISSRTKLDSVGKSLELSLTVNQKTDTLAWAIPASTYWTTSSSPRIYLDKGINMIRVIFKERKIDLSYLRFKRIN